MPSARRSPKLKIDERGGAPPQKQGYKDQQSHDDAGHHVISRRQLPDAGQLFGVSTRPPHHLSKRRRTVVDPGTLPGSVHEALNMD